jgi:hypothetical protein
MASSILNSDDGVISGTSGLKSTGGDDGNLVFQSKGTETARINTDKQIVAAAGTASLPIYSTTGDLNTGIFFPAADQVAIATNGVERVNLGNSVTVFNDGGANVDFRVEGDTDANLLFVDASKDEIGMGTTSTQTGFKLTIQSGSSSTLRLEPQTSSTKALSVGANGTIEVDASLVAGGRFKIGEGTAETVFNEVGADKDFRIESDTNTHALFVDAGNNKVAINSASVFAGAALNVYNGGILNFVDYSLSGTTVIPLSEAMTGGLYVMRDDLNGGTCLVLYENGTTPIIISQSGSNYTTGTPSGTQIKLSANGTAGIGASMAAGQTTTLRVMALICDPD